MFAPAEVRGPQRRRKDSNEDNQPVFLRKCYVMISTCPDDIASWSENGDTFVIRDVERFSSEIIPTVYKHNKFSSFVRQLNFYGFRKVRSDSYQNSSWWEFKHPFFRRGDLDSLSKIKKSAHFDENSSQNINEIRGQISNLNERMSALDEVVEEITKSLEALGRSDTFGVQDLLNKKRKMSSQILSMNNQMFDQDPISAPPMSRQISGNSLIMNTNGVTGNYDLDVWDFENILGFEMTDKEDNSGNASPEHSNMSDSYNSCSIDKTACNKMPEVITQQSIPTNVSSINISTESDKSNNTLSSSAAAEIMTEKMIESARISDIKDILGILPGHLQERFIDQLALSLGDKLSKELNIKSSTTAETDSLMVEDAKKSEVKVATNINTNNSFGGISPRVLQIASAPSVSMIPQFTNHYSTSNPNPYKSDYNPSNYMMNNSDAVAMAYPLASAALSAIVTSYHLAGLTAPASSSASPSISTSTIFNSSSSLPGPIQPSPTKGSNDYCNIYRSALQPLCGGADAFEPTFY